MVKTRLAGEGLQIPDGAKLTVCEDCGELLFVIKLTAEGKEVMVQPIVVRGLIPDVELIQTTQPTPPELLITKLVSRGATAKFSPPLMIPHNLVCIRAPLIRTLPVPMQEVAMGPDPTVPDQRVTPSNGKRPPAPEGEKNDPNAN
jgi:hypothetical protein